MAGRSLRCAVGLGLILGLIAVVGCGVSPVTPAEPTPTPGAHFLMPTPMAPVSAPPVSPIPTMLKYIVQEGDTLYAIALRYDVSIDELVRINKLKDPNTLAVGQELMIPLSPRETATPAP